MLHNAVAITLEKDKINNPKHPYLAYNEIQPKYYLERKQAYYVRSLYEPLKVAKEHETWFHDNTHYVRAFEISCMRRKQMVDINDSTCKLKIMLQPIFKVKLKISVPTKKYNNSKRYGQHHMYVYRQ